MKIQIRTFVLAFILLLVLIFAGLNWSIFSEPTELNLLVTRISAPIGVVMLGVVALLTVFYGFVMARYQVQLMMETGKAARELEKARGIADRAEESRIGELREYLETRIEEILRLQQAQLEQSETAAVDLAETLFGEATDYRRRLEEVERRVGPGSGDQPSGS